MFDFLSYLGNKVVGRYKTVESNIRSRSNSFYDSFLDLLEDTVKTILVNEDIGYDGRTCGEILREPDANNFFRHKADIDKDAYSKIGDYIKKINEHKHHNEKYVSSDTVVSYMSAYYAFITPYFSMKGIETPPFNETYFRAIYGITIERSKELDNLSQKVDQYQSVEDARYQEFDKRLKILEIVYENRSMNPAPPQPQGQINVARKPTEQEAMQWFFKNSKKSYRWAGSKKGFNKSKLLTVLSYLLVVVLGVLSTLVTSVSIRLYSTFTFFENVWLIFTIIAMTFVGKAKLKYRDVDMKMNSTSKFVQDQYGLWNPKKEKRIFFAFRWITFISVVLNIVFIWIRISNISWLAMILEILFLGSIILSIFADVSFQTPYYVLYLEGKSMDGSQNLQIVRDPIFKNFMTEEEYKKLMPDYFA